MFGVKDISVNFLTSTPLMVAVSLLVLAAITVYLYMRTNPPLPRHLRIILGGLRLIALLALFAALFELVMSFSREFQRSRRVALLLDLSSSMDKSESDKSRLARLDSLLSSRSFADLKATVEVTPRFFGGNVAESRDMIDREKTALGEAIYELRQQELSEPSDYWILFSDGRSNAGREPTAALDGEHAPIAVVDMASAAGDFDIALAEIDFNPIVFVGQKSEIEVKLAWQDALDKNIKVELRDSIRTLAVARLAIAQEVGLGSVKLSYLPAEPGQRLVEVFVPPVQGEETTDNNRRSFAVKVLKSRLSVLLVTDHPDYEVGFLRRFLVQSGKYDVDLKVTGSKAGNLAARFPVRQSELNRYDLVILYDPDPHRLENRQDIIRSYLSEKGGAIWVMMGRQYARLGSVPWFNRLLPFHQSGHTGLDYAQFQAQPDEGNLFHPAVRLAASPSAIREVWSQLPPFQSLVRCEAVEEDAVVLAFSSLPAVDGDRLPVLGYRRFGPGKVLASTALPFWPWGFVSLGFGEDDTRYGAFIEGVVSWLTVKDDFDPIRIRPHKKVFARGETVAFDGFAFDLGYRPIPAVTGTVQLRKTDGADTLETDLVGVGDGRYQAQFFNLGPGKYHYAAAFEKEGHLLKRTEGDLLVESFSLEEFDQSGDPAVLAAVARLSGGDYFSYREFDQALASIERTPVQVTQEGEVVIWNKLWLLIVMIAALSSEWLLRKAFQLV